MTALVVAEDLTRHFATGGLLLRGRPVQAVNAVSLVIARGETVGLVGESGSGKSTVGRLMLGLLAPTAGRVVFDGADLATVPQAELRRLRRRMQLVFQDPYGSLEPRRTVGAQIADALAIHDLVPAAARRARVAELLAQVGLATGHAERYPYAFSGGQRQRIGIARALAAAPDFLVADEPVSALDVSVQAQVLALLADLRARLRAGLDTTYVVDFVNEPDAVLAAFRQYHKTAELADVSDPNVVLDLRAKLEATGCFDRYEVERVAKVALKPKATQGELDAALSGIVVEHDRRRDRSASAYCRGQRVLQASVLSGARPGHILL